jgi:hypothetical protein
MQLQLFTQKWLVNAYMPANTALAAAVTAAGTGTVTVGTVAVINVTIYTVIVRTMTVNFVILYNIEKILFIILKQY